jgi:predicted dehydrogenase
MKKLTVNCIGLGHWGPNLVRNFATHPDARVGMVCDLSEERIALVRRNLPDVARSTRDAAEAISDPEADAVVISTPVSLHFPLAKAALEAGKHVLVEKPLCRSAAEGEELIALAERTGRLLLVGHVFLFNNGIRAMARLIQGRELGAVLTLSCVRTNLGPIRTDVNALWDLASHDLAILDYWMGAGPVSVTARGQSYLNPGVEDVVLASFTYPGSVLASVHASWLNPRKVREITVVGETKMAVWNDMDLNEPVRVYHKSVDREPRPLYSDSFGSFRMLVRNGDVVIPYVAGPEPLAAECAHFVDCVLGRAAPVNDAAGGLAVLRSLEAADRSMREGSREVAV